MDTQLNHKRNLGKHVAFPIIAVCALIISIFCIFQSNVFETERGREVVANNDTNAGDCVRPFYWNPESILVRDADEDFMDDGWESVFLFDSSDPSDADFDSDSDGYSNQEEFEAGTDPRSTRSFPGITTVSSWDFNCFYIAEIGLISDDNLLDILVRDPSEAYFPYIRDFVMVQQPDQNFELEYASNFEIPELTLITNSLIVADLNADSLKDLALVNLSDAIPGVNDQFVFSRSFPFRFGYNIDETDPFPLSHLALGEKEVSFFSELNEWIRTYYLEDYFDSNATFITSVPKLMELGWVSDSSGSIVRSVELISTESFPEECRNQYTRCYSVIADRSDAESVSAMENFSIEYFAEEFELDIFDRDDDSEENFHFLVKAMFSQDFNVEIRDYSSFNQDALRLVRNEMKSILEAGVMFFPSVEANVIIDSLREHLGGVDVFSNRFDIHKWGTYNFDFEHTRSRSIVGRVQRVLQFLGDRYISGD